MKMHYRVKDISGKKFNRITAIKFVGVNKHHFAIFLCRCECGTKKILSGVSLRSGSVKSCGCLPKNTFKNEAGKRYGRWLVISFAGIKNRNALWLCRCDCGVEREVKGYSLRGGISKSCGCYRDDRLRLPGHEAQINSRINSTIQSARFRKIKYRISKQKMANLVVQKCHYCGDKPDPVGGVDRIDSRLGYTVKNCVPCCGLCNTMKMEQTVEEFMDRCRKIIENFERPR